MGDKFEKLESELWKQADIDTWKAAQKSLKNAKAKYYEVVYSKGGIKKSDDLTKSYVLVYNSTYKQIGKLPLFIKGKKGFRGALYFLRDLAQKPLSKGVSK